MPNESELLRAVEATARAIIDAEFVAWEEWSIDDNEHIPRVRTIAMTAAGAAAGLGVQNAAAVQLGKWLLQHAEDQYLDRWMAQVEEGEDLETVREEGIRTFRHVVDGGRI